MQSTNRSRRITVYGSDQTTFVASRDLLGNDTRLYRRHSMPRCWATCQHVVHARRAAILAYHFTTISPTSCALSAAVN